MNGANIPTDQLGQNELNLFLEMGNKAIKTGDENESLKWYSIGLNKARELKNVDLERLFSNLIITLL